MLSVAQASDKDAKRGDEAYTRGCFVSALRYAPGSAQHDTASPQTKH